jgi:hypothetical protein
MLLGIPPQAGAARPLSALLRLNIVGVIPVRASVPGDVGPDVPRGRLKISMQPSIDYPISLRLPSQREVERRSSRRQVLQ